MKEMTYRAVFFSLYQGESMAEYLEGMAAQGWLLERPGNIVWRFRRIPPTRLHIEVVFFPDASGFDPGPTPGLRTMEDYCARDGWTLLARWGQAQIFMNRREDPVPIETDPVTQVEVLHKAMKRAMLPANFVLLGTILLNLGINAAQLRDDPVNFLSSRSQLGMLPFWLLMAAVQVYEIGYYLLWLRRARRAAEDGVFLPSGRGRRWVWVMLGLAVLLLAIASAGSLFQPQGLVLWTVCYAVILLLVARARDAMKRRGFSRGINRAVSIGLCFLLTFVFLAGSAAILIRTGGLGWSASEEYQFGGHTFHAWHDAIPLGVEQLVPGTEGVRYSTRAEVDETFLLARRKYSQDRLLTEDPGAPELEYTILEVKAPFLYPLCLDAMLEEDPIFEEEYRPVDPAPWGASQAWRLYRHGEPSGWYLLAWDDRIAEVRASHLDLTPERMAALGSGLYRS